MPDSLNAWSSAASGVWWPGADQFAKRTKTHEVRPKGENRHPVDSNQSNHRHADFQNIFINQLPGRPLPTSDNCA
jgi:hypothetical protein